MNEGYHMETIKIQKKYKPGEVNRNGYAYTKESYYKLINSEEFKQLLDTRGITVKEHVCDLDSSMPETLAIVRGIYDDCIEIEPIPHLRDVVDKFAADGFVAYMNYIAGNIIKQPDGAKICDVERIVSFSLLPYNS